MTDAQGSARLADVAAAYARTIVDAVRQEYPNAPRHVMRDAADQVTPRGAHPAFYGCFDWHSAVEMHWALVRLLRTVPDTVPVADVRGVLDAHLSADALATETEYLRANPGFERPYGWGWVLALAAELAAWDDPDARRWATNLAPLADVVAAGFVEWLPKNAYPVRAGMHSNSAFALARSVPYARLRAAAGEPALLEAIADAAVRWFAADVEYPAGWEPDGADFLSPALAEAELLAAIGQPAEAFPQWLELFLPDLAEARPEALFTPAIVADAADGQGAHLHGLNLYRAYAFALLADAVGAADPREPVLREASDRHAAASLPAVVGEGWMVEHWLAAYAVLLLSPLPG